MRGELSLKNKTKQVPAGTLACRMFRVKWLLNMWRATRRHMSKDFSCAFFTVSSTCEMKGRREVARQQEVDHPKTPLVKEEG